MPKQEKLVNILIYNDLSPLSFEKNTKKINQLETVNMRGVSC